jgi:hypothetical protein
MPDSLHDLGGRLARAFEGAGLWWGVGISIVLAVGTLVLAAVVVVTWPPWRFKAVQPPESPSHPVARVLALIVKNAAGILLVLAGAVMALPGIPGQGVLTMIIGLTLLDFPGKRGLEGRIVRRPWVLPAINRLRARFDRPPLEFD